MTLDVHTLDQVLLAGSGVLLLAILAVRASVRIGLPSLLVYLLIGVVLGDAGLGIRFDDAEVAHALGFAALILILAEGGLTTSWTQMRPVMGLGLSLATVGVAVSVCVVALFAHFALGMGWQLAVLLGAVTSPTDAAAVFSMLRRVPLPRRVTSVLEAESGLNDAPTVVLVTAVSAGGGAGGAADGLELLGKIVGELGLGVAGGLIVGYAGANPEKDAPEYFVARRGNRLMLNLIDAPIDVDIPETIFQAALAFIHERLAAADKVMIHCEQGVSRSATLGLLYLLRHTTALANTACRDGLRRYHDIYPPFSPGRAMRYNLTSQWAAYGGLPE